MTLDARIAGESRRGDVLFTERRRRAAYRRTLGTLGELARGRVLFEPFRNPLSVRELKSCVLKVVDLEAQDARTARRARLPLSTVEGTALCVITPTMSADVADEAGAAPMRESARGLYTRAPERSGRLSERFAVFRSGRSEAWRDRGWCRSGGSCAGE